MQLQHPNYPHIKQLRFLFIWIFIGFTAVSCSKNKALEIPLCLQELLAARDYPDDIQKKLIQAGKSSDYQLKMGLYNEAILFFKTAYPKDILCLSDIMFNLAKKEGSTKGQAIAMSRKALGYILTSKSTEAEKALREASSLALSINFIPVAAESENQLAYLSYVNGDPKEGIKHGKKALKLFTDAGNTINIPSAQINVANCYNAVGDYEEAIKYYLLALEVEKELANQPNLLALTTNIALSYLAQENYEQTKRYASIALALANEKEANIFQARNLMALGLVALAQEKIDSAIYWYKESLTLKEELAQTPVDLALAYSGLGGAYLAKNRSKKGLILNKQALTIADTLEKAVYSQIPIHTRLGIAYMQQSDFEQAQAHLDTALTLAKSGKYLEYERQAYNEIAKAYERQGDIDKAYEYYQKFHETQNSLFNQRRTDKIARLQEEFDKDAREQEIIFQTKEKETLQKLALSLFIGLFITIVAIIILFIQRRKISLQKKRINNLYEEIQHRIKNHLSFIIDFLEPQKTASQHAAVQQIMSEGQRRVEAIGLLYQKLYQPDKEIHTHNIDLGDYLKELVDYLSFSFGKDKEMEIQLDTDVIQMDIGKAIYLGLLTNELVTNAYKYASSDAQKGQIFVQLKRQEKGLYFAVEDNGPGLPTLEKIQENDSLGLRLISVLGKQLNGIPSIQNTPGMKYELLIK